MIHLFIDNKHILYNAEKWTLQKENNVEQRDSFILKHILVNNMQ
jgi:hypothetical protein